MRRGPTLRERSIRGTPISPPPSRCARPTGTCVPDFRTGTAKLRSDASRRTLLGQLPAPTIVDGCVCHWPADSGTLTERPPASRSTTAAKGLAVTSVPRDASPVSLRRFVRLLGAVLGNLFPLVVTLLLLAWSFILLSRPNSSPGSLGRPLLGLPPESLGFRLAGAALFAGLSAAAILEVAKRLIGLRGMYQQRQIKLWLQERSSRYDATSGTYAFRDDEETAEWDEGETAEWRARHRRPHIELERLVGVLTDDDLHAMRSHARSPGASDAAAPRVGDALSRYSTTRRLARFYDLPIEQLSAQIYAAMDVAVREPERFPAVMKAVTGMGIGEVLPNSGRSAIEVAQAVRAGVDALHIDVGEGWRNYVRGTAIWLSGSVGLVTVLWSDVNGRDAGAYMLSSLLLGGFLAWVLRDLAAAVERWRR